MTVRSTAYSDLVARKELPWNGVLRSGVIAETGGRRQEDCRFDSSVTGRLGIWRCRARRTTSTRAVVPGESFAARDCRARPCKQHTTLFLQPFQS